MDDNITGYMYVLEYTYPSILEIELTPEDDDIDSNQILVNHGYNPDSCCFMISRRKLELKEIKK